MLNCRARSAALGIAAAPLGLRLVSTLSGPQHVAAAACDQVRGLSLLPALVLVWSCIDLLWDWAESTLTCLPPFLR